MEILQIIASSWPIAVMFIALCVAGVVLYVIQWFKRADREDKAYRASQALVVRSHDNAG
jgi:heme/copper-type cytochrome/quinol oxidase subunit 2